MSIKVILLFVIVLMIVGGTFLFWYWIFGLNKNTEDVSTVPQQTEIPQANTIEWRVFEDRNDGYSLAYPVGQKWKNPTHVGKGEMRSIAIGSKGEHSTLYFAMFIRSSSDEKNELAKMVKVYSETFGSSNSELTILKEQEAIQISTIAETHYLFAKNNAVWIIYEPHFVDIEDKEIAEKIFASLKFFPVQEN